MHLRQPVLLIVTLLSIAAGCNSYRKDAPALALSPGKGKHYTFSLLRTGVDSSYNNHVIADTFQLDGKLEALADSDSITHFQLTFSNFKLGSSMPRTTMVMIDRNGKRKEHVSITHERDSIFMLLTGMHIGLLVNRKGEVISVEGLDHLMDSLAAMRTLAVSSVQFTFENYLSENAMKDIFNRVFYLFPDKPVKVTDQWGNDITLVAKAPVLFSNMYKLEELMNDRAMIRITSLISARAGEGGNTYMKGGQSGIAEVNNLEGLPLHLETVSSYVTTIDHYDSTGKEKLKQRRQEKLVINIEPQPRN